MATDLPPAPAAEAPQTDLSRMLSLLELQARTTATHVERTAPRENPNYKAVSIFLQPNGEPWAKRLKCEMYFGPSLLNRTPLTQAEVDALNTLRPVEKARIKKVDNSTVLITIRGREDAEGRLDQLVIDAPMKKDDNPQHYPPLLDLVKMLAPQAETAAA